MIPIADESPRRYIPVVNYFIIATALCVYIFQPYSGEPLEKFYFSYGLIPVNVFKSPDDWISLYKIFTSIFIHAGLIHLLGNLLFLWIFGDNIEYILGHSRYLVFFLVVGAGAAAMQIIFLPHSNIPMIGASGAISGVLGAYLVKFPRNRVSILLFFIIIIKIIKVPAFLALSLWFLFQMYNAYIADISLPDKGGVAWFAHIGGFLSGLILIKFFEWYPRYK
jgi:membrane associated rhomboid family serine protease